MEQGNMRADVNVSLRPSPDAPYGTRSETKNVNSFRGIEKTIQYEIRRQAARLDDGKEILQETRHWDEATQTTAGGRLKSDADDYRYFPDPDLVMLHITKEHIEEMKAQMPEMPRERRNRLKSEWGLSDLQMRDILNADALDLIEETVKAGAKAAGARKWWLGELSREANAKGVSLEELPITPADVAEVEKLIASGKLNDKLAKQTVEGVLRAKALRTKSSRSTTTRSSEDNECHRGGRRRGVRSQPGRCREAQERQHEADGCNHRCRDEGHARSGRRQGRHQGRHGQDQGLIRFTGSRWQELSNGGD